MNDKVKYAEYTISNNKVLKDGHTMFMADVAQDLKRKSYLEGENKALKAHIELMTDTIEKCIDMDDSVFVHHHLNELLSVTPEQSLAAVRNECYEKAAEICDKHAEDSQIDIFNECSMEIKELKS